MDGDDDSKMLQIILQYQQSIKKHSELGNDGKILHYISKLYDMPVTVAHLQETGIGKTVNALRKYNGTVGNASRAIVNKWKTMVAREEENEEEAEDQIQPDAESPQSPSSSTERIKTERDSKPERNEKSSSNKSNSNSNERKSHHKEVEKHDNSHKSSHSREKEHRSHNESKKHDRKRKHNDDETKSTKKKRYRSDTSSDDESEPANDRYNGLSHSDDNGNENNTQEIKKDTKKHHHHSSHHKSKKEHHDKKSSSSTSDSKRSSSHHHNHDRETTKCEKSSSSKKSKEKSSISSTSSSPSKIKKEINIDDDNGIDCGSGASFAEALGMIGPSTFKKKSSHSTSASPTPSFSSTSKPNKTQKSTLSPLIQGQNLLLPNVKLEPLDLNLPAQVPEITTNYKPIHNNYNNYDSSPLANSIRNMSNEEALSVVISSKSQRTKVYSGNKTNWGYVPSLFNLCVRILQDNIDALEYTGGVPYEILKPVLERATANQLLNVEYHNPYLTDDSDELWEMHCRKECRGKARQEMETWRDMFLRCRDERDAKLKALTVNIKQSIDKSTPVRQTKLAYIDNYVKPPRGVARKQAKYGTDKTPIMTPSSRLNLIASDKTDKVPVPNPGSRAAATSSSALQMKPKKAPLMRKTLAFAKSTFRR